MKNTGFKYSGSIPERERGGYLDTFRRLLAPRLHGKAEHTCPKALILSFPAFQNLLSGKPAWVPSLKPPLSSCVTLRKLFDVSVPLALHL